VGLTIAFALQHDMSINYRIENRSTMTIQIIDTYITNLDMSENDYRELSKPLNPMAVVQGFERYDIGVVQSSNYSKLRGICFAIVIKDSENNKYGIALRNDHRKNPIFFLGQITTQSAKYCHDNCKPLTNNGGYINVGKYKFGFDVNYERIINYRYEFDGIISVIS